MQLKVPGGTIDTFQRTITIGTVENPLREKEAQIIEVLASQAGEVVQHQALLQGVFGYNTRSQTRTLATTVGRTRQALERAGLSGSLLQSVYGEGYRWLGPASLTEPTLQAIIGRHAEQEHLRALAGDPKVRMVSLVGPGGIGKSTLARHLTIQMNGTFFVELADVYTLPGLLHAVGAALGVPGASDPFTLLHRAVHLLVLDNVEQLVEPMRFVVNDWLAQVPGLRIWCTSRRRLGIPGETIVSIGPLSAADGRALFLARSPSPPHATDDELASVVAALEGHPLSIELAAARCAVYSVVELQKRLEHHTSTVVDLIARSLALLEPASREALRQLATIPGAPTHRRINEVLQIEASIEETLMALIEHHLVRRVEGPPLTFRIHASARSAMLALTPPEALSAVQARWTDSVLRDAKRWEDGDDVDASSTEVLAALEQLVAGDDLDRACSLMLLAMQRFERGRDPETLGAIIETLPSMSGATRTTQAIAGLARLWRARLRDADGAGALADRAVEEARSCRDDLLICRALELRAQVLAAADHRERARSDLAEATYRHQAAGRGIQAASIVLVGAAASIRWGQVLLAEQALESIAGALVGAPFEHRFRHLQLQAAVLTERSRWRALQAITARLMALAESEGTHEHQAWAAVEHAFCISATRSPAQSIPLWREAIRRGGQAWLVTRLRCNYIGTLARERHWPQAEALMHAAVADARLAGGRAERLALLRAGWLARLRGDLPLARSLATIDPKHVGNIEEFVEHPMMYAQDGDLTAAMQAQQTLLHKLEGTEFLYATRRALLSMGDMLVAAGKFEAALDLLKHLDPTTIQPYEASRLVAIRMAATGVPGELPPAFDPLLELDNACWRALAYWRSGDTQAAQKLWTQVEQAMLDDALPPTSELGWRLASSRAHRT